jgi:hypothetical protein
VPIPLSPSPDLFFSGRFRRSFGGVSAVSFRNHLPAVLAAQSPLASTRRRLPCACRGGRVWTSERPGVKHDPISVDYLGDPEVKPGDRVGGLVRFLGREIDGSLKETERSIILVLLDYVGFSDSRCCFSDSAVCS